MQAALGTENPFAFLLAPFAPVYLVLLVAMIAAAIFPFRKFFLGTTGVGFLCLYPFRGFFGGLRLVAFFHASNRGTDYKTLWITLGLVMAVIAFIGWSNAPDYEAPPAGPPLRG